MLLKVGDAVRTASQLLPEAASGQHPSAAAAHAVARLADLASLSTSETSGLLLLGASILRQPSLARGVSSSVAVALQRVSKPLQRRYWGEAPPGQSSLFVAVRGIRRAVALPSAMLPCLCHLLAVAAADLLCSDLTTTPSASA